MQVTHPNKHIRQAVRYAARKGWRVTKAGPRAHIWGGHYGVLGEPVKAAAFRSINPAKSGGACTRALPLC